MDCVRALPRCEPQALGARAFDLLLCLIEHRDRVVGKDELLALVWPGVVVEENNLTVQVSALRKLLGTTAITTVPGRGYRLTLPVAVASAAAASSTATSERPSIAVLPFEVRGDDAALGFLADGLVEDVIARLARVAGFLVISRSSSFEFRSRSGPLSDVAQQLGVRYLVEGSVRRSARCCACPPSSWTQRRPACCGRASWKANATPPATCRPTSCAASSPNWNPS